MDHSGLGKRLRKAGSAGLTVNKHRLVYAIFTLPQYSHDKLCWTLFVLWFRYDMASCLLLSKQFQWRSISLDLIANYRTIYAIRLLRTFLALLKSSQKARAVQSIIAYVPLCPFLLEWCSSNPIYVALFKVLFKTIRLKQRTKKDPIYAFCTL